MPLLSLHQRNRESMIMVDKRSMYIVKVDNPLPLDYHIHVSLIYHYRALTNSLMGRTTRSLLGK